MTKSDLSEIKKRYNPDKANDNTVFRIAGCYVGGDGKIRSTFSKNFQGMDETETFKYFELFKKTLSGQDGKNAVTLNFADDAAGSAKKYLMALKESRLGNNDMLTAFYQQVAENLNLENNYAIFIIDDSYDVPVKTKDKVTNDIESDEVYHYLLCCICPVVSEKAGLVYDPEQEMFVKLEQRMYVDAPMLGFLYPAFNDRTSDENSIMYYTKKADTDYREFTHNVLQINPGMNAKAQKEAFQAVLEETIADTEESYEVISKVHENLAKMEEEHKYTENGKEPLKLDKEDIKNLLLNSGAPESCVNKEFDKIYNDAIGECDALVAKNIHNSKAYEVKSPDVVVKVKPSYANMVKTKKIDGKNCLIIEIAENVEVEGIDVKI